MTRKAWIAVGGASALAVALAVALVVSLASGGGGDDERARFAPQVFPGPGGEGEALEECLRENGAQPPERGTVPGGGPPEGFEEALEACGDLLPQGAPPGIPEGGPGIPSG